MKMTFIGSGAAFTANNYHSNILIESNGKKLLVDCGSDARLALGELGYSYDDIDAVYISHVHADHVGGLEWLGFCRKFNSEKTKKPELIGHKNILENLWQHSLSGGMKSLDFEEASLGSYFEVKYLDYPANFKFADIGFKLIKTLHVRSNEVIIDSYGLFITFENNKIFLTTDTRLLMNQFINYYEDSDIIFHDCETQKLESKVHTHYKELVDFPMEFKKKIWLYHYNSGSLPDAQKDGFLGFIKKGQSFEF